MKLRWRFGIIAGLILAGFSLYPQMRLVYMRGGAWNGNYAYSDVDEVAYAAYLGALIDGRPRRNDPYTGRDASPEHPQAESLFSIQFAAPYTVAIPARVLGIGVPWAMSISGAVAAFLTGLALFWLIRMFTADDWFAMAGSLVVMLFGTLTAGEGAILEIVKGEISYPFLPGFRRYVPALALPAFFALIGLVWQMINRETDENSENEVVRNIASLPRRVFSISIIFAILAFAYTVFSYFYVWTAALAWFASLAILVLVLRPLSWRDDVRKLLLVGCGFVLVLIPYFWLLTDRPSAMDSFQLIVNTHAPDLLRLPELISGGVLLVVLAGVAMRKFPASERSVLLILSLSLTNFAIFNQQIITGRSLQPVHYQVFVGNYVAALALVLAGWMIWRHTKLGVVPRLASAVIALLAISWGSVECAYTIPLLDEANLHRDISFTVSKRLRELDKTIDKEHQRTVLAFDLFEADEIPSAAPQNVLWARHQAAFAGLTRAESEERFLKYLYYLNINGQALEYFLQKDFVTITALFGWDRHSARLSAAARPLTQAEISNAVKRYDEFRRNFKLADAADPLISYVVVPNGDRADLISVRRWYELDDGEALGDSILYRVTLRTAPRE